MVSVFKKIKYDVPILTNKTSALFHEHFLCTSESNGTISALLNIVSFLNDEPDEQVMPTSSECTQL